MDPAIEVTDLFKRYGSIDAVRGIDFTVARGEVFGLLGPNGAGKTTTVEILEGYRTRSGGEVRVLGFDPRHGPGRCASGWGSCCSRPACTGTSRYARRSPTGPGSTRTRATSTRSSGSPGCRRRRTPARGRSPAARCAGSTSRSRWSATPALFLDEPTTGFDPAARRNAWDVIRSLRELGKTVLLTTHYLDEASALADRVAIIKDGRILAEGAPSELGVGESSRYRVAWRDARGEGHERVTDDPTTLLAELTTEALARGERLDELSVTRPSLEEVYLELTADQDLEVTGS